MIRDNEQQRMRWASRRGMLELDLVLGPFVDTGYAQLDPARRADYERLMGCEDQQLFAWFLGREHPEDPALAALVTHILQHNASARSADATRAP